MTITTRIVLFVALVALLGSSGCSDDGTSVTSTPTPTDGRDLSPPAQIVDPSVTYDLASESATLTWTAPTDDDRVESYDVRYTYSFPLDWNIALRAPDPPSPSPPGETETFVIANPIRGRDLYAAIRSVDPSGNLSPISNIAHARIIGHTIDATCITATTNVPVEGLAVTVTARQVHQHVSDDAGRFEQTDLTAGAVHVAIRPGASGAVFHYIDDSFELTDDMSIVYKMIEYAPTQSGVFENVFQLFKAAASLSGPRYIFKKWRSVPVPLYFPSFVNDEGLDYRAAGIAAADRWEEKSGVDLWEIVDTPPADGVTFTFKSREAMGIQVGYTEHTNDADNYPVSDAVSVVNDFKDWTPLYKTMLHELGHTIRFAHLPAGFLMYGGQPLPDDITDDEALAVRIYTAMPNGLDIRIYDHSTPAEAGIE